MAPLFEIVQARSQAVLSIRGKVGNAEIPVRMGEFFGEVAASAGRRGIALTGPPFALYHSWSETETDFEAGFPVGPGAAGEGRVAASTLPGGRVVTGMHVGPYDTLHETYAAMTAWMQERGLKPASRMWETYLSDPAVEKDPARWMTRMFWPVV